MGDLQKISFQLFKEYSDYLIPYFPDLKTELKQAGMPYTVQEYVSMGITISIIMFAVSIPLMAFLFGFMFSDFLFGFLLAMVAGFGVSGVIFYAITMFPKVQIKSKAQEIDDALPFAVMYLSTISGSKLPLFKTFDVFTRFMKYGEVVKQINNINEDVKVFGLDIVTALERAIDRSPSKTMKEVFYGMLSTIRSGANMNIYLKEKSNSLMGEYRRRLYEFSHSLTIYVEIYLTSIVLGAIFFTVLTAIISGLSGAGSNVIMLQFILVFVFMPLISAVFLYMIKSATPGGE